MFPWLVAASISTRRFSVQQSRAAADAAKDGPKYSRLKAEVRISTTKALAVLLSVGAWTK